MSTHSDQSPPPSQGAGGKRIKPHQLVVGIGCFMGLFTLVSGILPQLTKWREHKSPSREVFFGIPGALQVGFYTVIPVM
ncbi:MAG: iron-sulfur protein, partial [Ilumatobacteraceae bacterium]